MLKGETILCFAPDPWGDIWRNRHRLLAVFARTNRVIYVEPRTTVRHLRRKLRTEGWSSLWPFRRRVMEVRENLFVVRDQTYLPRTGRPVIGPAVDRLREASLRRVLRRLGATRPIVWLVRPESFDLPGKWDEKALFYQVVDDYLSYPGVTPGARARLDREERSLAARSNFVVVTAEHLLEQKRHLHERLVLVRNGVDAHTLEEGLRPGGEIPAELRSDRRPVWGYIGGITEKLDLPLLERLARKLEGIGGTLALVGPVNVSSPEAAAAISRLRASPAVFFAGQRPADEVPSWIRGLDVGLIPYKIGDQARAIDPLKLYEYLAFGKPIVGVRIPSLEAFRDVVEIATDAESFVAGCERASRERDEALAARRRTLAAQNSWEERAERISQEILSALERTLPSAVPGT